MWKSKISENSDKNKGHQQYNYIQQNTDTSQSTKIADDILKNNNQNSDSIMSSSLNKEERKPQSVEELQTQLENLMDSLATVSAEKSKMEATFQADKKQLKGERDQCEKTVKDLKEKWKKLQNTAQTEIDNLKYKLIMERHEREKEQSQHSTLMKELQKLVSEERRSKEQMESQIKELKSQMSSKSQNKVLGAELEIMKNKLKQTEAAAKGTSPLLLSLQTEMTAMKKQHRIAIHEEHKRVAAAEQQARALAITHETRVAGLEARLSELSKTVGGYDRLRQKDQQAIQNLKEQLIVLQNSENKNSVHYDISDDPDEIIMSIRELCKKLMDIDGDALHKTIKDLRISLNLSDPDEVLEYKKKYENLIEEFEEYKKHIPSVVNKSDECALANNKNSAEVVNDKGQIHRLKTHCRNLEERIRNINSDSICKEKEYKQKLENMRQILQEEQIKYERLFTQKENEFRGKLMNLEQQILRQRERSLAMINEKDQEIHTLKSSFQALLPRKTNAGESDKVSNSDNLPTVESAADLVCNFLTMDNNPPMLHYAQELARKEVQVTGLRKQNVELEAVIREKERELMQEVETSADRIKELQSRIERLEACKSREGANLEYLKNVFVNYLISTDNPSKRHMLNAISTILRFTSDEMEKIRKCK